ncbi:hypothetical protein ACHAP7_010791 [Fusarium lateritium]
MASAGPCKPRAPTDTSFAGVSMSNTSSAGATISQTTSAGVSMSETVSVAADATTLPEPPAGSIIENSVTGGGMTSLNPFVIDGHVEFNTKDGFTGDGSSDTSAAELMAPISGIRKRQNRRDDVAAIKQMLTNLDVRTQYTIQFYYYLRNPTQQVTSCVLEAFIGSQKFYTTDLLGTGASISYNQVLVSTRVTTSEAFLNVQITCTGDVSVSVLIDSIFVSNQVSVENIGDYRLDFGDGVVREPVNLPATTQSTQVSATQNGAATATEVPREGSTTAGNGNSAEPTTAPQRDATSQSTQGGSGASETGSSETTSASDNSGKSTTVAHSGQETETAGTFVSTESLETTPTRDAASESTAITQSVQETEVTQATEGTTKTTTSSAAATTTDSAAEETSATTTTGFSTEETITPIRDAQPVQEDCVGQNLIDNGDFEHASDSWEMYGNAAITYNGQFGRNSRTNSGQAAVAVRWPQINGVRAAFKRTVPDLIPGMPYLFGWAYHVVSGGDLPDNMCTITATFGGFPLAPVDPLSVSEARTIYRNIMNHVSTPDPEIEVVFELSCSGNPRPFAIIVDDVFLNAC